jgi:hypothetical protein
VISDATRKKSVGAELRGNEKKKRVDAGERIVVNCRMAGAEISTTTGRNGNQAVDENDSSVTASSRNRNVSALNGVMAPRYKLLPGDQNEPKWQRQKWFKVRCAMRREGIGL